jgi:hypothetical protein
MILRNSGEKYSVDDFVEADGTAMLNIFLELD